MHSWKNLRLVLSVASVGLCLVCASSEAGRSIRSDASDSAFDTLGGFWGTDAQDFGVPGAQGRTQFRLNFGGGAQYYTYCMSEDGFIKFITGETCSLTDYALPPSGNYVAVFATDLAFDSGFGSLTRTRGFVDTTAPMLLTDAAPAMRFWWNGVNLAGDAGLNTFDVQVVLIDRSQGSNNGNFDLEFNYGNGSDKVPPTGTESNPNANGVQGFKLGSNSSGPVSGPFGPFDTSGAPIRFCFRNGKLRDKC